MSASALDKAHHPPLLRPMLPESRRHLVHPICRIPHGFRLLKPGEWITRECRFTVPRSPRWYPIRMGDTRSLGLVRIIPDTP